MVLKMLAWLAIVLGALAVLGGITLASQWWPFWLIVYIVAGLLIVSGVRVLRRGVVLSPWLTGAWGFACATSYTLFFSQVSTALQHGAFESAQQARNAYVLGPIALVAAACFVLSLLFGGVRRGVDEAR